MPATATRRQTAKRDPLIDELVRNFGVKSERELRRDMREAMAWANKHGIEINSGYDDGGIDDGARYLGVELGTMVAEYVPRVGISLATGDQAWKSPAHRRLLASATALFLMTCPLTRRLVERS